MRNIDRQLMLDLPQLAKKMLLGECCEKCVFYNGIEIEGRVCFHKAKRPEQNVCEDYFDRT